MQFCVQDLACEVKMLKNINSENLDCWQQRKKEDIIVIVFVVVIVVVTLDNLDEEKSEVWSKNNVDACCQFGKQRASIFLENESHGKELFLQISMASWQVHN